MKIVETADTISVVYGLEHQKELLGAASAWVDERHTLELYDAQGVSDPYMGEDVKIVAPHTDIPVTGYVPLIGDYDQIRQCASRDEINRHGDTALSVRTAELEDGTDVFGFTTNFGRYAYPTERRLAVVPSIALLTAHVDGNASLVVQNRAFGERAWLQIDKNTRLVQEIGQGVVELSGLRINSDKEADLVFAAQMAADVVFALNEAFYGTSA